jgi:hypothetical protein
VPQIELVRTGGTDRVAWTRSRYLAVAKAIRDLGFSPEVALGMAVALTAHYARETGWGGSEYNYAIGNIKAGNAITVTWTGDWQIEPDGLPYRAYRTLEEGARGAVALASSGRYADAWEYLKTTGDGVGWYDRLMRAGWHPWSEDALVEFRSITGTVSGRIAGIDTSEVTGGGALANLAPGGIQQGVSTTAVVGIAVGGVVVVGLLGYLAYLLTEPEPGATRGTPGYPPPGYPQPGYAPVYANPRYPRRRGA